jgi:hypothetical protein
LSEWFDNARRQQARACKTRLLVLSTRNKKHFYFLSIIAPADGIKAAKLKKRRLRYITVLWAALSQAFYGQLSVKRLLDLYAGSWGAGPGLQ